MQNAVALCRPTSNAFRGDPFVPTTMTPLDLFPHTEHCELVVVLERPPLKSATTAPLGALPSGPMAAPSIELPIILDIISAPVDGSEIKTAHVNATELAVVTAPTASPSASVL